MNTKLSLVTNHLQLAQGLLSNIPMLQAKAKRVVSDVFESDDGMDDVYGVFVPESLKPCTYNFSFGP